MDGVVTSMPLSAVKKKKVRKPTLTSRGLTFFINKPLTSSLYYKQENEYFQNVFRKSHIDRGNIKVRTHTYSGVLIRVLKFLFRGYLSGCKRIQKRTKVSLFYQ